MPRYLVTGTRLDQPGSHEVPIEAPGPEDACRIAAEEHGLREAVAVEEPRRAAFERIETPMSGGMRIPAEPPAKGTPADVERVLRSARSAIGCLTFSMSVIPFVAVFLALGVMTHYDRVIPAVAVLAGGVALIAIPNALISLIELASMLVRQNRR